MESLTYIKTFEQFKNINNNPYCSCAFLMDWDGNIFSIPKTDKAIIRILTASGEANVPLFYGINWEDQQMFSQDNEKIDPVYFGE
jgi:hypothetical protein